jgi:hypothetical protein
VEPAYAGIGSDLAVPPLERAGPDAAQEQPADQREERHRRDMGQVAPLLEAQPMPAASVRRVEATDVGPAPIAPEGGGRAVARSWDPWPALPQERIQDDEAWASLFRSWERRQRLDREQRGEV